MSRHVYIYILKALRKKTQKRGGFRQDGDGGGQSPRWPLAEVRLPQTENGSHPQRPNSLFFFNFFLFFGLWDGSATRMGHKNGSAK
jgi:hypothetical protein